MLEQLIATPRTWHREDQVSLPPQVCSTCSHLDVQEVPSPRSHSIRPDKQAQGPDTGCSKQSFHSINYPTDCNTRARDVAEGASLVIQAATLHT